MAKSSKSYEYNNQRVKPETVSVRVKPTVKVEKLPEKKRLRLLIQVRYRYQSQFTNDVYVWSRANDVQLVDARDAQVLLAKVRKGGCCGSTPQTVNLFEEVI